jgi:hypothetical protein
MEKIGNRTISTNLLHKVVGLGFAQTRIALLFAAVDEADAPPLLDCLGRRACGAQGMDSSLHKCEIDFASHSVASQHVSIVCCVNMYLLEGTTHNVHCPKSRDSNVDVRSAGPQGACQAHHVIDRYFFDMWVLCSGAHFVRVQKKKKDFLGRAISKRTNTQTYHSRNAV